MLGVVINAVGGAVRFDNIFVDMPDQDPPAGQSPIGIINIDQYPGAVAEGGGIREVGGQDLPHRDQFISLIDQHRLDAIEADAAAVAVFQQEIFPIVDRQLVHPVCSIGEGAVDGIDIILRLVDGLGRFPSRRHPGPGGRQ